MTSFVNGVGGGGTIQRVNPDLRLPLLELLNTPKRMIVEPSAKIEPDHRRLMLLDKSQEFGRRLLVLGSLYDRHHGLVNAPFFHPSLSKTKLSLVIFEREVERVLDRDNV